MTCPICDNKPANCDCSDIELDMHERITSQATRIRDLETALNNAADHAKEQEARIKALEAECAEIRGGKFGASVSAQCDYLRAERDALRAEVARLKDPDTLRNVNARDNIARIKNLHDALEEALEYPCSHCDNEPHDVACRARIRAIAAGAK